VPDKGSDVRDPEKFYPGSTVGGKRHQIRIRKTKSWTIILKYFFVKYCVRVFLTCAVCKIVYLHSFAQRLTTEKLKALSKSFTNSNNKRIP
jgi:hypothetical protein